MTKASDTANILKQPFTNTLGTSNYRAGVNAGDTIASGGNYNTVVGDEAGTAITTGDRNVAIGYAALDAVTTASYNTAIGYNSATANTSGASNVSVGDNTFSANTEGDNNTTIGQGSLRKNTTGDNNVAVGLNALGANTTADDNTAVGYQALVANTTGAANTAVGMIALDANTTGNTNTAIGYGSLGVCTEGFDNTALGVNSGFSVTTGDNNLLLGHDAGRTGSPGGNITTANNTIVLGDENIANAHIQVDWTVASDQRDKTDFTDLDVGLDFVNALKPVTYKWDKRSNYGDKTPDGTHKEDWLDVGFKAQEVEALEKTVGYKIEDKTNLTTSLTEDGKQYGIQYTKFVPILVKALQELSAKNDSLETSLTSALARIKALEDA